MRRCTQISSEQHAKLGDDESKIRKVTLSETEFAQGSTMTFYNISYKMKVKTGYYGFRKTTKKVILKDIRYNLIAC